MCFGAAAAAAAAAAAVSCYLQSLICLFFAGCSFVWFRSPSLNIIYPHRSFSTVRTVVR